MNDKKSLPPATEIKLTPKQKAFADHYFTHQNALEAVKAAGYAGKNLHVRASRLKYNESIKTYMEQRAKELVRNHAPQLVAMAHNLKDKDQSLIEAVKLMQECKEGSPTKFKYFELLARLNQHLNDNNRQNFFVNADGKDITIDEVISEANEARMILRQIRIQSEAIPTDYTIDDDLSRENELPETDSDTTSSSND